MSTSGVIVDEDIKELNRLLQDFIVETTKQSAILKVNQTHLTNELTTLTSQMGQVIESNNELEKKYTMLQENSLDRLNLVEDTVNEFMSEFKKDFKTLQKDVQELQLTAAKEEQLVKRDKERTHKYLAVWSLVITGITAVTAIITLWNKSSGS